MKAAPQHLASHGNSRTQLGHPAILPKLCKLHLLPLARPHLHIAVLKHALSAVEHNKALARQARVWRQACSSGPIHRNQSQCLLCASINFRSGGRTATCWGTPVRMLNASTGRLLRAELPACL